MPKTYTGDTGVSLFCQDIGKKSIVKANLESDVPPARNRGKRAVDGGKLGLILGQATLW